MTLMSGKTCGKCVVLERELLKRNIEYTKQWAEDSMNVCRAYDIYELPTLLINPNTRITGLTKCMEYIKEK